jgi:electron transfer flavoprotein beta subunit
MGSLNILVCVKQVPASNKVKIDPESGLLERSSAESKLNPYDLFAVEFALELKARYGCSIFTLTMGPPDAAQCLMETLYMGCDHAILLSDRRFGGADVLATGHTLKEGIRRAGDFALILCGKQTTDGDTAQVGPELAEQLGIPNVSNVFALHEMDNEKLTVKSYQDNMVLTQEVLLPCLLSIASDCNTPRLPSYRRMKAITKEKIFSLGLDDLSDKNDGHYGLKGSATQVQSIYPPATSQSNQRYFGTNEELAGKLYDLLLSKKFLEEQSHGIDHLSGKN